MRVVLDTNVIASALFFGGRPAEVLSMAADGRIQASRQRSHRGEEYQATFDALLERYHGRGRGLTLASVLSFLELVPVQAQVSVCRDPDDDKFIGCAMDGRCLYVVSGDKDLLTVGRHQGVRIVTVAEFLEICAARP